MPTSTLARAVALALLALPVAGLAADERLAVLEFTGRGDPALLAQLADEVRSVAADGLRGRYVVLTREAIALVVKQMGGTCKEGDCEVETARNVGAALVATGELRRIEKTLVLGLKLHETEKGALLGAETIRAVDPLKLLDGCREAAKALLGRALPAPAAAAPPPQAASPAPASPGRSRPSPEPLEDAALEAAVRSVQESVSYSLRYRIGTDWWNMSQQIDFGGCRVKVTSRSSSPHNVTGEPFVCTSSEDFALGEMGAVQIGPPPDPATGNMDFGSNHALVVTTASLEERVRRRSSCGGNDPKTVDVPKASFWVRSADEAARVAKLLEQLIARCRG
jgi:hypothetical protein